MSSQTHSLKLNRETVRELDASRLCDAQGGAMVTNDLCPNNVDGFIKRVTTVIWTA